VSSSQTHLLLVQEQPGDTQHVRELLRSAALTDVRLTVAPGVSQAMEAVAAGTFSAVLLDLGRPDSQWLEALHRIRSAAPHLPTIIYSGATEEGLQRLLQLVTRGQAATAGHLAQAIANTQPVERAEPRPREAQAPRDVDLAYETTIEGWSRALDLRDKETEGHSLRVTEMTLALAKAMGMSGQELVQIRRGALLHDIGKMGIPDHILLKPGPLTPEEWAVMKQHPQFAYELLAPIAYLRPALDIPYCHHEKWDGTGYPRGLRGEQIPLAARIFAIADVWDALRSDRPYRPAWPAQQVRAHMLQLFGTHFDPRLLEPFLAMDW